MKVVMIALLASMLASSAGATSKGIWLCKNEIMALPTAGGAWSTVQTAANSTWPTPELKSQTKTNAAYCVAGALVAVRTGNTTLRDKVRDNIMLAVATLDDPSEYVLCSAFTDALGRQLYGYVIAADLIDLQTNYVGDDAVFRPWLAAIRSTRLTCSNSTHGVTIRMTAESGVHNQSAHCLASITAADLYLGYADSVARAFNVFKALSDRSQYPTDAWFPPAYGDQNYFTLLNNRNDGWLCGTTSNWTGISPACDKTDPDGSPNGGIGDLDGSFFLDICRRIDSSQVGPFMWYPDPIGMMYSWECLEGYICTAEMLHRAGYDAYGTGSQQIKRGMDFMVRAGWQMNFALHRFIPWIANYRYGTSYATLPLPSSGSIGRSMYWTDWTHAGSASPPGPITDLVGQSNGAGTQITVTFTAPGGAVGTEYDVRVSYSPIDASNFSSATRFTTGVPVPAACGQVESFPITGFCPHMTFYVAIKWKHGSTWSAISNVATSFTSGTYDPVCALGWTD